MVLFRSQESLFRSVPVSARLQYMGGRQFLFGVSLPASPRGLHRSLAGFLGEGSTQRASRILLPAQSRLTSQVSPTPARLRQYNPGSPLDMDTLHGPPTPRARLIKLLHRIKRLAQLFGQLSEDEICRLRAGDIVRTVRHGRHLGRAVTDGDVAVDLHHHRGVKLSIVVEGGVVTWYLTGVSEPSTLVDEAVGPLGHVRLEAV